MNTQNDPFRHFSPKQQKPAKARRVTNFLEAFKETAAKRPAKPVEAPVAELEPGSDLNVAEAFKQEEAKKQERERLARERMLAKQREEEEQTRFAAKQKEVERQIEALREAILKIAKSTQHLSREVEKAAFETPVMPGTYHLNFFEKLKSTLEIIKKRIDDSASWMHAFNQRKKRMPFYWQQVKKSGTKYLLSQERYMSTSAG